MNTLYQEEFDRLNRRLDDLGCLDDANPERRRIRDKVLDEEFDLIWLEGQGLITHQGEHAYLCDKDCPICFKRIVKYHQLLDEYENIQYHGQTT